MGAPQRGIAATKELTTKAQRHKEEQKICTAENTEKNGTVEPQRVADLRRILTTKGRRPETRRRKERIEKKWIPARLSARPRASAGMTMKQSYRTHHGRRAQHAAPLQKKEGKSEYRFRSSRGQACFAPRNDNLLAAAMPRYDNLLF